MRELFEACQNEDEEEIWSIEQSSTFQEMCEVVPKEKILLSDNGITLGLLFGKSIYFGNVEDGILEGYGVLYLRDHSTIEQIEGWRYNVFKGEWKNDKPNGEGEYIETNSLNSDYVRVKGNYLDGLENGKMTRVYAKARGIRSFNYTMNQGKAVTIGVKDEGDKICNICSYALEDETSWLELEGSYGMVGFVKEGSTSRLSW